MGFDMKTITNLKPLYAQYVFVILGSQYLDY